MDALLLKIEVMFADFKTESSAYQKGNKSAGRRARVKSNEITKLLKEFRALDNAVPTDVA